MRDESELCLFLGLGRPPENSLWFLASRNNYAPGRDYCVLGPEATRDLAISDANGRSVATVTLEDKVKSLFRVYEVARFEARAIIAE